MESISNAASAVGILSKEGVVLACEKVKHNWRLMLLPVALCVCAFIYAYAYAANDLQASCEDKKRENVSVLVYIVLSISQYVGQARGLGYFHLYTFSVALYTRAQGI